MDEGKLVYLGTVEHPDTHNVTVGYGVYDNDMLNKVEDKFSHIKMIIRTNIKLIGLYYSFRGLVPTHHVPSGKEFIWCFKRRGFIRINGAIRINTSIRNWGFLGAHKIANEKVKPDVF